MYTTGAVRSALINSIICTINNGSTDTVTALMFEFVLEVVTSLRIC